MPFSLSRLSREAAIVAVAVVSSVTDASAQSMSVAESAYDRVAKAWASHSTLEAQFDQKIMNPLVGRTASSRGTFQQQKPGRVSITFTDPVGDRIVGDGKSLWVYLPSSTPGQVLKLPADADGAVVADLLGQLLDAPKRAFTFTGGDAATIDGRTTKRVIMAPRTANSVPFTKATLWLDDQEPRPVRIQVTDTQGVERTITLTTWVPNATLPKDAFTFKPPKGVKVVTKIPGA